MKTIAQDPCNETHITTKAIADLTAETNGATSQIHLKMLLNGQKVDSISGMVFPIHNPASGEVIGTVPKANAEDVARAIEVAIRGRAIMATLPAHRRSEILGNAAAEIGRRHEELSQLLARETARPSVNAALRW